MINYIISCFGVDLRSHTQIRTDSSPTTEPPSTLLTIQPLPLPTADPITPAEATPAQNVERIQIERQLHTDYLHYLERTLSIEKSRNNRRDANLFISSIISCCIGATTCALPCTGSPQIGSIFFCTGTGICIYQRICTKNTTEDIITNHITVCNNRLSELPSFCESRPDNEYTSEAIVVTTEPID